MTSVIFVFTILYRHAIGGLCQYQYRHTFTFSPWLVHTKLLLLDNTDKTVEQLQVRTKRLSSCTFQYTTTKYNRKTISRQTQEKRKRATRQSQDCLARLITRQVLKDNLTRQVSQDKSHKTSLTRPVVTSQHIMKRGISQDKSSKTVHKTFIRRGGPRARHNCPHYGLGLGLGLGLGNG